MVRLNLWYLVGCWCMSCWELGGLDDILGGLALCCQSSMLLVDWWLSVNVDTLIWNMEMFRGLSVSWSERAAVWPIGDRGVPTAGRLIARSVEVLRGT